MTSTPPAPSVSAQPQADVNTPTSLSEPGFYHFQAGEVYGPLNVAKLRERVAYYQILDDDILIYQPGEIKVSGKMINLLALHLQPDETIEWIDLDTIITKRGVFTGNQPILFSDIHRFELLHAKLPRATIRHPAAKALVWTLGILLCWTIVAPLYAYRLTREPDIDPRFHPSVNGIRLHGYFDKTIIAESMGFYSEDAPEIESLRSLYGLLVRLHHESQSASQA